MALPRNAREDDIALLINTVSYHTVLVCCSAQVPNFADLRFSLDRLLGGRLLARDI
jgi:hypothetical protein